MSIFYLCVTLFMLFALLLCCFPWLKKHKQNSAQTINNKTLIKQRLTELESEKQHGLLDETDQLQSENELKLALLDEVGVQSSQSSSIRLALLVGGLLSVVTGAVVYWQASQLSQINHWQSVQTQTSDLGQRMIQGDNSLTLQDLQNFALGLRTKLVKQPEDAIGWMLLGRVSGAINRLDSAIQALEKSLQYDPNNTSTMASYAQALLMTGQEQQVLRAKQVLLHILSLEPDNTNAMGVLAVVASELGDTKLALENWQGLLGFVPVTDPNYQAIEQRIAQLKLALGQTTANLNETSLPKVVVTVNISQELKSQLPASGFLFVFAQESTGKVKFPAAVVKVPLGEFPVVIELSNENAMMPNYTLSQLQQAKLVARVSLDENVAQSPGELQGELMTTLSSDSLTQEIITIDRVL